MQDNSTDEDNFLAVVGVGNELVNIRWLVRTKECLILHASNPNVPTRVFARQDIHTVHILGRVHSLKRKLIRPAEPIEVDEKKMPRRGRPPNIEKHKDYKPR